MMHGSLTRVLVERERLCARVAAQRTDVGRHIGGLGVPIGMIDRSCAAARFVRAHPSVIVAGFGAALALRARSVLGLVARAAGLWRLGVRVRQLLRYVGY